MLQCWLLCLQLFLYNNVEARTIHCLINNDIQTISLRIYNVSGNDLSSNALNQCSNVKITECFTEPVYER